MSWLTRAREPLSALDGDTFEVARRAAAVLVVRIAAAGLAFGVNVIVARRYGATPTGVYFLALTTVSVLATFGRVGLDKAVVRFAAERAADEDWGGVGALYRQSVSLAAAVSAALAGVCAVAAPWISDGLFSEPALTPVLRIMAVAVVPMALVMLHAELLNGLLRPVAALLLSPAGVQAAVIAGVLAMPLSLGVEGVAVAFLVANTVGAVVGWLLFARTAPQARSVTGDFPFRRLVATSLPFLVTAALVLVMGWADTIMLGIFRTPEEVAVFGAATRTATLVAIVLLAFNAVVPPRFAVLHASGDVAGLGRLARSTAALMALVALPIVIVMVAFPERVLSVFGSEFTGGAGALVVLSLAQYFNVASGTVAFALAMTGHQRQMQTSGTIAAVANVALNLVLIPAFGIMGAAVATGTSLVVVNLLNGIQVYRRLGFVPVPIVDRWARRRR